MSKLPSKKQLEFLDWEFGVFFHFGIRSFFPGHKDWDGKEMPAECFYPSELNCEQWILTAKKAGARYAVLTAKHHDGFALWNSKYTSYSVAKSSWRDGKGDVVREFTDACRKHGLRVGLYYSPAQWGDHAVSFSSPKEYDDYFINQLSELLTGYGKIDYLWFDGCGSENHTYDHKRIVSEIYRLQPDILTFCDPEWTPGVRWIGNEDGYASLNNPLVVSSTDFSELAEEEQLLSEAAFLPAECDCKMRNTWFFDDNEDTIKSVDELFGMYESSVGRGSNFLLNVGPDDRGLLPKADADRLLELGERIHTAYGVPLPFGEIKKDGDIHCITHTDFSPGNDWSKPYATRLTNCVTIEEDLTNGQSITSFKVYASLPVYSKKRILVFEGHTVGHKIFCRFPAIRACRLTVEVTGHNGDYVINSIKAYYVK